MKVLTLSNGKKIELCDGSTFAEFITVFGTGAEAGAFWANFTEEALTDAYLGDEKFSAIPQSMSCDIDENSGNITAHYMNFVTYPKSRFESIEPEIMEMPEPIEPAAVEEVVEEAEEVVEKSTKK